MNIPTAEEWLSNNKEMSMYDVASHDEGGYLGIDEKALYKIMIEFAKLHVEAQTEAILKITHKNGIPRIIDDERVILNAYSLTNIK